MAKPLITIITVTYNSALYVRDAIEGVLAQNYKNIEYIIADDCSTDNTWQIINEYKDERIVAYRNVKNLREYPNRNKAINLAKGDYLIFIDGDDVMLPTAIEYLLFYANQFPDAALLIQKNYFNHILFPVLLSPKQSFINAYFGKRNLLNSSFTANFFKTEVLKKNGGLAVNYISGDDEIRQRIALQHNILLVQGWVSWPRETPNQASSKISIIDATTESLKILNTIKNNANKNFEIINELVDEAIQFKIKNICIYILYFLKKLQIKTALQLAKKNNLGFLNFIKALAFNKTIIDEFDNCSPANPYKKEFNLLCNRNNS